LFRLYLLTHYGQVSGIIGGRFGEISRYAMPWGVDTECVFVFGKAIHTVTRLLSRVDLSLDPRPSAESIDPACAGLHSHLRVPVRAGSYFGSPTIEGRCCGFFLDFPPSKSNSANPDQQMVFAVPLLSG
jgi:hypothetical protein